MTQMSKKHFELIAEVLEKANFEAAQEAHAARFSDAADSLERWRNAEAMAYEAMYITELFAHRLERTNPRFNANRFREAAGLGETE